MDELMTVVKVHPALLVPNSSPQLCGPFGVGDLELNVIAAPLVQLVAENRDSADEVDIVASETLHGYFDGVVGNPAGRGRKLRLANEYPRPEDLLQDCGRDLERKHVSLVQLGAFHAPSQIGKRWSPLVRQGCDALLS